MVPKAGFEPPSKPAVTAVGLSPKEVQGLIDKSLDKKLAPIVNMLTESMEHGPKFSEVIGGVGYIVGLVGVGLYFGSRRKVR